MQGSFERGAPKKHPAPCFCAAPTRWAMIQAIMLPPCLPFVPTLCIRLELPSAEEPKEVHRVLWQSGLALAAGPREGPRLVGLRLGSNFTDVAVAECLWAQFWAPQSYTSPLCNPGVDMPLEPDATEPLDTAIFLGCMLPAGVLNKQPGQLPSTKQLHEACPVLTARSRRSWAERRRFRQPLLNA